MEPAVPPPPPLPTRPSAAPPAPARLLPRRPGTEVHGHWALVVLILAATCFMMRAANLMALPIFGDEAIYLRWAQLIRGDSAGHAHWWVSLADPKPPLHFWLMALVFHWTGDPLASGRMISVFSGVISVPLVFLLCCEMGQLLPAKGSRNAGGSAELSGRMLGILAALFMIFCPFISFYQRLATADALFVAESLAIVWLSLRWAALVAGNYRGAWIAAWLLGIVVGLALLTRQGISYTLCAIPVIAWVLHAVLRVRRPEGRPRATAREWMRGPGQLFCAALLAGAMWSPFLFAELPQRALNLKQENELAAHPKTATVFSLADVTSADRLAEIKRRIFYQEKFTDVAVSRAALALRNFSAAFVPNTNRQHQPISGWLYYYLTPPVYIVCLLGLIVMVFRGRWGLLALLVLWLALTLGPVILLGNMVYSRYVLAGVPPLLIAGAFCAGEMLALFFRLPMPKAAAWVLAIGTLAGLVALPLREMGLQSTRWWAQTLTQKNPELPDPGDYYQYISGWTAGYATQHALLDLMKRAREGSIVVITGNEWGTPADALWVYLSEDPHVRIFSTDQGTIGGRPAPGGSGAPEAAAIPATADPNRLWLRPDKWLWPRYVPFSVPPDVPVYYVTKTLWESTPSATRLKANNPNLVLRETFKGMEVQGESDPDGAVNLFELRRARQ